MSAERPFTPTPSSKPADWIVERLTDFGVSVLSVVPSGFEAYARVFHPAAKMTCTADGGAEEDAKPLRWSEVAELTGRTPHRLMQWASIRGAHPELRDYSKLKVGDIYIEAPTEGSLPLELAQTLWPIFEQHTEAPDTCFFAVWEGFGGMPKFLRKAPAFEIPARRFYLFEAPIQTIEQSFYTGAEPDTMETVFVAISDEEAMLPPAELQKQLRASLDALNAMPIAYQSANLWWPKDRAWCVHTEIDFNTTYVAGSQKLVDAVLASEKLEVYQLEPTDELANDAVNPIPNDPYGSSFKIG